MQPFEWGPSAEWQAESAVGQMKQAQPSRAGRAGHAWDRTAPGLKVRSQKSIKWAAPPTAPPPWTSPRTLTQ